MLYAGTNLSTSLSERLASVMPFGVPKEKANKVISRLTAMQEEISKGELTFLSAIKQRSWCDEKLERIIEANELKNPRELYSCLCCLLNLYEQMQVSSSASEHPSYDKEIEYLNRQSRLIGDYFGLC